jgi:hypothetical protein
MGSNSSTDSSTCTTVCPACPPGLKGDKGDQGPAGTNADLPTYTLYCDPNNDYCSVKKSAKIYNPDLVEGGKIGISLGKDDTNSSMISYLQSTNGNLMNFSVGTSSSMNLDPKGTLSVKNLSTINDQNTYHTHLKSSTGIDRFTTGLIDSEGDGNIGSNYFIRRHDNSGTSLGDYAVKVNRSTGDVRLSTGLYLPSTGGSPSSLNYYEEYTQSATFTGAAKITTGVTLKLVRIGKLVNMTMVASEAIPFTATSVDALYGSPQLPPRFCPSGNNYVRIPIVMINNGVFVTGIFTISSSDGNFNLYNTGYTGFTGGCYIVPFSASWSV